MSEEESIRDGVERCDLMLCGAGISVAAPANIPPVSAFLEQLSRRLVELTGEPDLVANALSPDRGVRFEQIVSILHYLDQDLAFLDYTRCGLPGWPRQPNVFHQLACRFLQRGHAVLTTNFDALIELAYAQTAGKSPSCLHKLHGSIEHLVGTDMFRSDIRTLGATLRQVSSGHGQLRLSPTQDRIRSLVDGHTIMIVGYSCSDSFDVVPALRASKPAAVLYFDFVPRTPPRMSSTAIAVRDKGANELLGIWSARGTETTVVTGDFQYVFDAPAPAAQRRPTPANPSEQIYRLIRRTLRTPSTARLVIGMILQAAGDFSATRTTLTRAMPGLRGRLRAQALYRRARVMPEMDLVRDEAMKAIEALRRSRGAHYREDSIEVHIVRLDAESNLGPFDSVREAWQRFESLLRSIHGSAFCTTLDYGKGLHGLALATLYDGRPKQACRIFQRSVGLRRAGGAVEECNARAGLCLSRIIAGALRESDEEWQEFLRLASQLRGDIMVREIHLLSAMLRLEDGNPADALAHAERANDVMNEGDEQQIDPEILCLLAIARWNLGQEEVAKRIVSEMLSHSERHGFLWQARLARIVSDRFDGRRTACGGNRYFRWFDQLIRES